MSQRLTLQMGSESSKTLRVLPDGRIEMDGAQIVRGEHPVHGFGAEEVGAALREYSQRTGEDLATLPRERLREIAEGAFADGGLEQATPAGQTEVEFSNGQEAIESRIAQWFASLRVGGSRPRAVEARAEDIGAVARGADNGAAEQGDVSRDEIREQSQRLIERAKAEGHFWGADSPILFALNQMPSAGGAEHQVFLVGEGDNRFIIRGTDNGYFGPRSDISPAQYLARLDDAAARAMEWIKTHQNISAEAFGEEIANAARDHGCECAHDGEPSTTGKWKRFRVLLAELVKRASSVSDDPLPVFRLSEDAASFIKEHSENCPDVETGDETVDDVADYLRDLFQSHAEAAVFEDRKKRAGVEKAAPCTHPEAEHRRLYPSSGDRKEDAVIWCQACGSLQVWVGQTGSYEWRVPGGA